MPSKFSCAIFALTRTTSAPRLRAAFAIARPCFPLELLPIYRTGSIASRVPPAVTKILLPKRSELRSTNFEISETILETSGYLPTPKSSPVILPSSGSITKIPLARSVATFATVAWFNHISGCIAGTKTIGLLLALIVFVRRSSQIPLAILASRSAVAGATTIKFVPRAAFICGTS